MSDMPNLDEKRNLEKDEGREILSNNDKNALTAIREIITEKGLIDLASYRDEFKQGHKNIQGLYDNRDFWFNFRKKGYQIFPEYKEEYFQKVKVTPEERKEYSSMEYELFDSKVRLSGVKNNKARKALVTFLAVWDSHRNDPVAKKKIYGIFGILQSQDDYHQKISGFNQAIKDIADFISETKEFPEL